jgi:hypothetical protein
MRVVIMIVGGACWQVAGVAAFLAINRTSLKLGKVRPDDGMMMMSRGSSCS